MTVLFVDDEKQILRGIERMLDAADVEWEAEFANGAEEALEILADEAEIDTVVTDMKMPGMDGAQLLQKVSEDYPHVVRIVLSGEADKEAVFRAIKPMHQYLAKPCDAERLKSTISRASALRDLLHSKDLKRVVGGISKLPSVPKIYQQIVEEIQDEDSSIAGIGDIISQDGAMTAKLLQIANSAVFALRYPVNSAAQAATFLGVETIKALVLSVGIFQEFEDPRIEGFSLDGMMNHAHEVAMFARKIAMHEDLPKDISEIAFTSAMLHDIGKLVLLKSSKPDFASSIKKAKDENVSSCEAEMQFFGIDHTSVGAHLLSIWGIPQPIVESVAFHHAPNLAAESKMSGLTALCAANWISNLNVNQTESPQEADFMGYLDSIGCESKLEDWTQLCTEAQE